MTALNYAQRDELPGEDHIIVLQGAAWADYLRLLEIRGDRSAPRITYVKGLLEVMSPSKTHETLKSRIGRLVDVWCEEHDIPFEPVGSWTLKDEALERGVEPDECYIFSDHDDAERPDLAIEVIWTSGGLSKLAIYKELGVREVWYWKRGVFSIHVLRDGEYEEREASEVLPGINLTELASQLDKPTHRAIRDYRDAVRRQRH